MSSISEHTSELAPPVSSNMQSENCFGIAVVETSFTSNSCVAQVQHEQSQAPSYVSQVKLKGSRPYSLKKVDIGAGPYKGCQALALVPNPSEHFPFLDLPLEIRNMIYKMLLTREGHDVYMIGMREASLRGKWFPHLGRHEPLHDLYVKRTGEPIYTSIISTCKQIHSEAAKLLYSSSRFALRHPGALRAFLKKIGSSRTNLRSLEIHDIHNSSITLRASMELSNFLIEARDLNELRINCGRLSTDRVIDVMAAFGNLFKVYQERDKDQFKIFGVVKLVNGSLRNLSPSPQYWYYRNISDPQFRKDGREWSLFKSAATKAAITALRSSLNNDDIKTLMKRK